MYFCLFFYLFIFYRTNLHFPTLMVTQTCVSPYLMKCTTSFLREQGDVLTLIVGKVLIQFFIFSAQFGTTYVKKLIEDNCTMEETVRFFAVSFAIKIYTVSITLLSHMICSSVLGRTCSCPWSSSMSSL